MPDGFLPQSAWISKAPQSLIPKCEICKLYKQCKSPKMEVAGEGRKGILIVGESPGADEDDQGESFVGKDGIVLAKTLKSLKINMRRDCWLTNALICHPMNNAAPKARQIEYCRPNILNAIDELKPRTIILAGAVAVKSVIGHVCKENPGTITKWAGWKIPDQTFNAWICPIYSPSNIIRMRNSNSWGGEISMVEKRFVQNLKSAVKKKHRPWKTIPDYSKDIEVIFDAEKAAKRIIEITQRGGHCSFDYETNMLKPDGANSKIFCASICWMGKETIAFPWFGPIIPAFKKFLKSPLHKSASNMKFEDRWSKAILGVRVRNWDHDSMLMAHGIDNRAGITGLKFQSYIMFGMPTYNHRVSPFLKAAHSREENRIKEVALSDLLPYCGLDSLLEYKVMMKQRKMLNWETIV